MRSFLKIILIFCLITPLTFGCGSEADFYNYGGKVDVFKVQLCAIDCIEKGAINVILLGPEIESECVCIFE